jgi:glyceraldehyde 3-phosphate dehydrogenase
MIEMKIAINGFGRIGRLVYRLMKEDDFFDVVAINDLSSSEELAYLLRYDTNHRTYDKDITFDEEGIIVDGKKTRVYSEMDPSNLPWGELGIDLVFECTGKFTKKEDANKHILAGAKKVLISAPGKGDMKTVVYNVNDATDKENCDRIEEIFIKVFNDFVGDNNNIHCTCSTSSFFNPFFMRNI